MRRGKFEIIGEILSLTTEPSTKTSVVYRANLNFNIVNRYLDLLLRSGLVGVTEASSKYEVTEKGLEFLNAYRNLKEKADGL
ncbi:MAG: winged helix-turn-helix domain-containing protein [Candidatus Hadarchaeota archaeon]|nr:winged helix-turn-helix domain-containing protein [Candidatus Hadarchaeota archaeon]